MRVSQHKQHQDTESEAAKWNSDIINFIIYTYAFSHCDLSKCPLRIKAYKTPQIYRKRKVG